MSNFKKYKKPFLIGTSLIIASSYFAGQHQLFEVVPNLDKLFHFIGGFIAAWLVYLYLKTDLERLSFSKRVLVIVSTACFIGVVWEWAEHLSTFLTKENYPMIYKFFHGGDLIDTMWDLVMDSLGALVFALRYLSGPRR